MLISNLFRHGLLSSILALFVFAPPANAADVCIDSADALQNALTQASANGQADRIFLVQGTYTGPFVYTSSERQSLQVLGGYDAGCASRILDPTNTTLQGDGADRVLTLTTTNGGGALTLEGVTITGGVKTGDGGGLYASTTSNITLRDNLFQENRASGKGGGAYIASEGTMYVERNTFSNNGGNYDTDEGGGIYVFTDHGSLAMSVNTFDANVASNKGGGATLNTSLGTLTLTDNRLENNRSSSTSIPNGGGGFFIGVQSNGIAALAGNTFTANSCNALGGGVYFSSSSGNPVIILTGNNFATNSTLLPS